ncbi:hypothetical protein GCM10007338_21930 [Corynebacterium pelargi]|nr:hypothetical protein GCM10007338_21930 [Corynebacterium pelargi]
MIGERLDVSPHTIRGWLKRRIDRATTPVDLPVEVRTELQQLRVENLELHRSNEILKAASAFFAQELDHPSR